MPREQRDDFSEIWGEELLSLESENTNDHERQNVIGKPVGGAPNMEKNDTIHENMMELEPLLEASEERNRRSIDITHGECPCQCLLQTVWYPDHANLCLVWDVEKIRSIGLPEHRQKVTLLVVSTLLALRWIEENVTKYRESKTTTAESIYAIDYSRRMELFETACKVFAIPMEVRHVWSRLRFFPWFRATSTSWLYMVTKDHMKKYQQEYRQFQAEIGPEAFKRHLLTHRNAITKGWKRVGRVSRNNTKARESILEGDLAIEEVTERVRLSPTRDEDLATLSIVHGDGGASGERNLEASEERNLRSIDITHGQSPCHCLAQTVWYPNHANLCLIWDVEEIRSIGLPDHRQKVTLLVVSTLLALRCIEENVTKYRESKTPTSEQIYAIDYSRRLELFDMHAKYSPYQWKTGTCGAA